MSRSIINIEDTFTEGDYTTLTGTIEDLDGTIIDITGATIECIYWFERQPPSKLTGTVTGGTAGTFSAAWDGTTTSGNPAGIDGHGRMHFIWRVTDTNSQVFTSTHEYVVTVEPKTKQV